MEVAYPVQDALSTSPSLIHLSKYLNVLRPVQDFAPIPNLISHVFRDVMRCDPTEHPVLVTEPAWNTSANRERMAQILFEEFQVPAFYIANTGVLNA